MPDVAGSNPAARTNRPSGAEFMIVQIAVWAEVDAQVCCSADNGNAISLGSRPVQFGQIAVTARTHLILTTTLPLERPAST